MRTSCSLIDTLSQATKSPALDEEPEQWQTYLIVERTSLLFNPTYQEAFYG